MPYTQDSRLVAIDTPLGKDVFLLTGFSGREEISRLFSIRLDLASETADVAPEDLVGKAVSIRIGQKDGEPGWLHGHVRRLSLGGTKGRKFRTYRAEIVPWLWFLTQSVNCRIFQDKTSLDIIKSIFDDLGFSDYEVEESGSEAPREYCVQYRESDFDFVSRLMEEEGLFYYFRHEKDRHVMVIADSTTAYKDCAQASVDFSEGSLDRPHVSAWEHSFEFQSGAYAHTDYYFETPSTKLLARSTSLVDLPGIAKYEVYDWPGIYARKADGDALAKIRMEEIEARYSIVAGAGTCGTFHPGGKFKLLSHPWDPSAEGKSFALTAVEHKAVDESKAGVNAATRYDNAFTCIPDSVTFRPARTTQRPVVRGCQTAVVVGPEGEEIYTDKYGRVKLSFHWDRGSENSETSSCWVRVSQNWAGKNWGAHFHPRIGQEVIVDFLDGDPDRPLVTGRVYNAELMPPYELPANQTQSGIKTRSSLEGTAENFNEIRFEDKKDEEEIYFHAEKDFNRVVENNDTLKVGSDEADDGSQTIEIFKDRTETVKEGNETVTIEKGDRVVTIGEGAETLEVKKGARTVTVGEGDDLHTVSKGKRTVEVAMGDDIHQIKQGKRDVTIDMGNDTLTIKMGNQTTKLDLGKVQTEAMQSIELKVGQSSVKIDQTGVTIKGMKVTLEGTVKTDVKGLMVSVAGDAMLQAKGAITMIG